MVGSFNGPEHPGGRAFPRPAPGTRLGTFQRFQLGDEKRKLTILTECDSVPVGKVSGVLPDALRFCFDLVAEGTTLAGARLEITEPNGRARCRACGAEFDVDDLLARCGCGSVDLELTAGQEFLVRAVEVA